MSQTKRLHKIREDFCKNGDALTCLVASAMVFHADSSVFECALVPYVNASGVCGHMLKFNPAYLSTLSDQKLEKKVKAFIDSVLDISVPKKNKE